MSESGDYSPGPWSGHDFKEARKTYDKHVGRSYEDAVRTKKESVELVESKLKTNSESPLVIACDVTGSMGEWPSVIFSKLPYLDLEGQEYLGKGMEISFAAVGDVYSDKYPLQARKFTHGTGLKKTLTELVIEGKGGPGFNESYDIAALYYARNVEMPKAIHPLMIFIGDEGLYDFVDRDSAKKYCGIDLTKRTPVKDIFEELKNKYSVYLIRKPYYKTESNTMSERDVLIHSQWASLIGEDHIAILPEPGRVVDDIFGVMAKETDRVNYFRDELKGRQTKEQVKTVLESLHTVHKEKAKKSEPLEEGASVTKKTFKGEASESLFSVK